MTSHLESWHLETQVQMALLDDAQHHEAFRSLNEEWIRDLFGVMGEVDYYELDHPTENIIRKGGNIFIALLKGEFVGSFVRIRCKIPKYDYWPVKFAIK